MPFQFAVNSWEAPEQNVSEGVGVGPVTGCGLLDFGPTLSVAPETSHADTPSGLAAEVSLAQEGLLSPEGTSAGDLQDTTVTLPVGIAINPGQAAGLGACQYSQDGVEQEGPATCPSDSKVGHAEGETPLLRGKLEGEIYLLASNPPHLKLLVTLYAPVYGIYVKAIGSLHLNETTGQVSATFSGTPPLPFSNLRLAFSGGAQAALSTPTECGLYQTDGIFTPWGAPFISDSPSTNIFPIESGTDGAACPPTPLPFTPSMDAGATTDQAGGYTSFSMLLTRPDDQQRISSLQFKTPEGLLAMIATVPLCNNAQAEADACPESSQVGHTVVEAGPGPYPLVVPQPGSPPAPIYLTGPYEGAPFGLLIKVPLVVGPFVLETQVVRAKIEVDELTSRLTITTGAFPTILNGVPADLRAINAVIDRPGFMFNPTSCAPMSFSGTATSAEGATFPLESHFQMGSCRSLLFQPNLIVSTSGKTSRNDGASLDARIVYPTGNLGANQASSQSNIQKVTVELPKQLPSRLTTLQKACTEAVFSANPASCPAASMVGYAKAITPVVPVPLMGPVYFVSNGQAKFPEVIIMLQGYGVTVELRGETFISKTGITSTTIPRVPDVPIASFELYLPEGPNSALAANGDLCTSKLVMPTEFIGQNGAELRKNTPVTVTGCAKASKARRARAARTASHHRHGNRRGK